MKDNCKNGCVCKGCKGNGQLVGGLVIIATAVYWPAKIWIVLGALIALKGLLKKVKPACSHCK